MRERLRPALGKTLRGFAALLPLLLGMLLLISLLMWVFHSLLLD